MSGNLKEQGFRFAVSPDGCTGEWWHPGDRQLREGWYDCSEMGDEEFSDFVIELQQKSRWKEWLTE